jgi:hypothetical protein
MMCQGSLRGMFGFATRLGRGRYTVMWVARIYYVGGAHRLCALRSSMHQGRRHYHHNRYNRYVQKKGRTAKLNAMRP